MNKKRIATALNATMRILPCLLLACSCNVPNSTEDKAATDSAATSALGSIELYNGNIAGLADSNVTITVIGKGYAWSEGPLWLEESQTLLFSDVPNNKIYQWTPGDTPQVYLSPSGYTGRAARSGEVGSNGLALDAAGQLIICQHGNRQVARMQAPLNAPTPNYRALATSYKGKKLNSPNDLVADRQNNIYFTDPIYGLPNGAGDSTRELAVEGVYKLSPTGVLTMLIDSIPRPNGIGLSADEQTLYIASSDEEKPAWYAYKLDEKGNIASGGLLLDARPLKDKAAVKQGPDGFKLDAQGNIFSSGPDGINIISPAGELLGLIKIYDRPTSNCTFNAAKDVLYITANDVVLRVVLKK